MAFTLESSVDSQAQLERAVLVHVEFPQAEDNEQLDEFYHLVTGAGVEAVAQVITRRGKPHPALYIGTGKTEEIAELVKEHEADVVLFNHTLTPAQERNLERQVQCRVLDRTGLILDIFAQRARTYEGRLQVELAQLNHLSTRLVRGWTHLERQKGGIGLRGPGETQLETDRRLIRDRIGHLKNRLAKVKKQRSLGRRARERSDVPLVSLVGYTNAGKSTLFNRMTDADVYVADQLFATLDPTIRRIKVPGMGQVVLADTVGFIRHLPHRLVEAFHATLEETVNAELLLHVVDASNDECLDMAAAVDEVLKEIDADEQPQLQVFNKADLISQPPRIDRDEQGKPTRVWLSATTGEGMDLLYQAMSECLSEARVEKQLVIPPTAGRLRAGLFEAGEVLHEQLDEQGNWLMTVCLSRKHFDRLLRENSLAETDLDLLS